MDLLFQDPSCRDRLPNSLRKSQRQREQHETRRSKLHFGSQSDVIPAGSL